jgi:peptide/nickel transport system permease protein
MSKQRIKSRMLHSFLHDPSAIVGCVILVVFILAALLAPWITPQNPYDLETLTLEHFLTPPIWMEEGQAPYLLGTDDQGRGIFSTIIYGCRTSLIVGFSVVLIAGTFGVIMGLLAGYYGGWIDAVTMRLADTLFSFSTTLLRRQHIDCHSCHLHCRLGALCPHHARQRAGGQRECLHYGCQIHRRR